ncbi:MAG: M56 family metallopeptidase, partial [Polyangiaceae bacterium]
MMPVSLLNDAARVGLAVIVNSLWQGVIIAFVAWAALRVFSRANAATRYATWSFALAAMIVIPVLTSLPRVTVEQAAPAHVKLIVASPPVPQLPAVRAAGQPPAAQTPSTFHGLQAPSVPRLRFTTPVALAIFGIWLLAALVVLGRLIVAIVWLERLKSDSLPLDVAYRDQMPQWNAALKDFRDVRLCVSDAIEVPVAIGLFDAMILLPKHIVQSLEPEEIDQIALHELGHLRRNDDWTNALQRVACSLLFFNPAAWFVSRQLDIEREVACDDYVLQATGAARSYAFCLTRIAEVTSWPHRGVAAPGVFITRRSISIRIERLLRTGRTIGSAISPVIAASVIVALVLVSVLVRTMTPSVAYTLPAPVNDDNDTLKTVVKIEPPAPSVKVKHIVAHEQKGDTTTDQQRVAVGKTVGTVVGTTVGAVVGATVASAENTAMHAAARQQVAESLKMAKLSTSDMKDFCTDCDYRHADLNGRDFSKQNLNGADFEGAKLRGARFDNAHLVGTNFSRADLRDASFANANLVGCNLSRAQLDGTNFAGARLVGCNFEASNLSPQQARIFLMSCTGCNFGNADLHGVD